MVLKTGVKIKGIGGLFPRRASVEGTSPETYDIGWQEQLTQNISKALAVDTYTLNHDKTGSILNIYDESVSTELEWRGTGGGGEEISTLILDLGINIFVHSTIMVFGLDTAAGEDTIVTTSYSEDGVSYTQIDTDTETSATEVDHDHYLTATKYRFLKIVGETNATNGNISIKVVRLIR